jgi:hypothetical protein
VTRLLEKRKQMLQVQESLDAQKDEYSRKEELFKRREENLRKKDLELQEALGQSEASASVAHCARACQRIPRCVLCC